jgi:acetyltransferase-like isoleucine patch superfamily enzyme
VSDASDALRGVAGDLIQSAWAHVVDWGTIRPGSARARRFDAFGAASAICFPPGAMFGERHIRIGAGTVVGPYVTLSAGVSPEDDLGDRIVLTIGDRTVIGKGSGIVAQESVVIGDDVFTGHHVYITDANHGYEDVHEPIGRQFAARQPVEIGDGSWLGHGTIVLPGARIGRHVVVGAGSVVTGSLPDRTVAVGDPARVVRRHDGTAWVDA